MKIAIFTETFLPQMNGVVRSICNITEKLSAEGHEFCVFAPGKGERKTKSYTLFGFGSVPFPPYPEFRIAVPRRKKILAMCSDVEVIHSRGPFSVGWMGKYVSRKKSIPLIGTFDTPVQQYTKYIPLLGNIMNSSMERAAEKYISKYYNMCNIVTVPSEMAKKDLIRLGCRKRIEIVTNGVDVERFSPKNNGSGIRKSLCKEREPLLLYVGRISEEKRTDVILRAMDRLRGENIKLVVVGRGPKKRNLEEMAQKLGLKNVVFTGAVSERDLPNYYAACDLFVSASPVETEGITFLEAMATGKPIIGAAAGAATEIIQCGFNGEKFQPGDSREMSEKIKYCLENYDMKRIARNCTRIAREKYSLDVAIGKLRRIYYEQAGTHTKTDQASMASASSP